MKQAKIKKSSIVIVGIALVLLCLLAVTLYNVWHRQELSDLRDEALARLERDAGEYDERSIVLQNTSRARAEKLAELLGATLRITSNGKYATLTLPEGTTILDVYRDPDNLAYLPELSTDYQASISDLGETSEQSLRLPSRPSYAVSDADYALQGYLDYLNMKNVWNSTTGRDITVAVIDTGIDTDHPEFAGRISEYSYNATEDKIVKDYLLPGGGYDWSLIEDEQGHGTAVTGVIAAGMNSDGIVGIAPSITIITIKAEANEKGKFTRTSDLVFGLDYAIERDVDVVNMSFTVGSSNVFADATQLAVDSDIICVAAAGNDSSAELQFPAADPNVFGVGALEADGWALADYSSYGENVNLVAPGTTYTTLMDGKYGTMNGTSLAAPVVTGAIALYLSVNPYQEFRTIEEVLYASCYDLGDLGCDYYYGYGALDVSAFLLEERGKVTFDMLTDELENTEQLFIRNHTLQNMPEPERPYAIFDGWYYDPHCLEEYNLYVDRFSTDLTLYAKWVNEEDGIPFTYVELEDGTVEIRSYTGHRRYITIPDMIDGKIVSSIGEEAFKGENRLLEVILPKHLVRIRRSAFEGCGNLVHIDIPDTVIEIGDRAFYDNVRLSYVGIGGNSRLQSIGMLAFSKCAKLQRFELPATVASVDGSAFFGATNLTAFTVRFGNKDFTAKDGVLFDDTQSTLVAYPAGLRGEYSLPSTVRIIGDCAFGYASFDGISLGNVQVIGDSAFANSELESIVIPDTVIEMGEAAFDFNTNLSSVQLGNGLTVIPGATFHNCWALETIEIPASIREIRSSAFLGAFLTSVKFASDSQLTTIGPGAFAYSGLESVEIPASVISIESSAFFQNLQLVSVRFTENSNLRTIGVSAFEKTVNLKAIDLPAQLETVGAFAFKESGLEKVTIPASLISFGAGAFAECHSLTDIAIEEANTAYTDVDGVVYDKDKTTLIEYPAGNSRSDYAILDTVTAIEEDAFYGSWNLRTVHLPESLQEIRREAFYDCQRLGFMQIPDNVVQISNYAFAQCRSLGVRFNDTSKLPRISFGAFAYCGLSSFRVPASVSTIAQGAFSDCADLRSFTFAANSKLESISAYMFSGCDNLNSITFEEGSALTSIQAHGFEGMANLSSIDFGDAKLENIDNFAFRFCESLTRIDIPESVTEIGRYAFYYCTSLSEIRIPASVEFIGRFAFLGTKELSVYFASEVPPAYLQEDWDRGIAGYYLGVTDVITDGDWEYAKLTSGDVAILQYLGTETDIDLTSLDFGGDIVNIGGKAFSYSTIESIVLPETLVTIQNEAFYHSALRSVSIPASVQFIGRLAFADTPIETLAFAGDAKLRVLEQSAFEGTKSLASVALPKSLTTIGRAIFKSSGIASLTFEEGIGITEISEEAFAYTNITAVTIPDGVTLLNHSAFRETKRLKSVDFGSAEDVMIMSNVFYHSGLESVHIPANVTYVGEYAFVALTNLQGFTVAEDHLYYRAIDGLLVTKDGRKLIAAPAGREGVMTVPAGIEVIGFGAFEESKLTRISFLPDANILSFGYRAFYGSAITEMHIPASVVAIDYYAFATCKNLTKVTFAEENQLRGVYEGAFYACSNLHDITLPDTVVEISDFAFYGCRKIDRLPISENSTPKGISDYAFAYAGLDGDFTTPETLIDIGAHAFMGNRFTSVTIPDANAHDLLIGLGAFEECNNLQEITLPFIGASFEAPYYTWFGYIFGAPDDKTNSIYVPENLKKIILSEGISVAAPRALAYLPHVEEIDLPDSLTYFGGECFVGTSARHTLKHGISLSKDDSNINIGSGYYGHLFISGDIESFGGLFDFKNLTGITLPDTVTTIRDRAFSGCTSLTSIVLPEGVKSIGEDAFSGCTSLTEIVLPDDLVSIGARAFRDCTKLTNIAIPESVTNIGETAFWQCSALVSIVLPPNLTGISNDLFRECSELTTIGLPDGITEIGDRAFFGCTKLTNIALPKMLTRIGDDSFSACGSLSTLVIPEGVTSIGDRAFAECRKLKTVNIPSSVKEIGEGAFSSCVAIESVHIDHIANWCAIEFSNYDANPLAQAGNLYLRGELIENLIIPDGVEKISNYAFVGGMHSVFQSVTLPSSIVDIESKAFRRKVMAVYNNSDLPITLGGSNYGSIEAANVIVDKNGGVQCHSNFVDAVQIKTADGFLFEYVGGEYYLIAYFGTERRVVLPESINGNPYHVREMKNVYDVVIPYGITDIGYRAFNGCTTLTSIEIPDSVTTLGSSVFSGCSNLESVQLSKALTELPSGAFSGCSKLTDITIPDGVTSIGSSAFYGCSSLESVELPQTLETIYQLAFGACSSLTKMTIPEKVQNILENVFNGCGKLELKIAAENPYFEEIDGVIYDRNGTHIVYIPDSVESICVPKTVIYFSIRDNKTIKHVRFEAGNAHLGMLDHRAFMGCEQLTTVALPDGITSIPSRMFENLRNLTDVVIPESVTSIDAYAFRYCESLTNIVLPKNLKKLGDGAFARCLNLTNVTIPEGVTNIGGGAFSDCWNLTNVTIPEGVTNIGSGAFGGCKRLTSVMIPENVTSIGDGAFSDCDALVSVRFLGESTNVSPSMFAFCDLLTDVTLSKNLTSIGDGAFSYCSSLTDLTIPKSVTTIGIKAFAGTGLNSVLVDEDSSDFGVIDGLLYNKKTMEIVYVPSSRKGSLTIPEGIAGIRESAFSGCSAITSIILPDSIVTIGNKAFDGCTGLGKIIVPNSLMSIGDEAFSSCSSLEVVINRSALPFTLGGEDHGSIALHAKVVVNADGSQQCLSSDYIVADGFLFYWNEYWYSLLAYLGEEECVTLPKDINGQKYLTVGALKGVSSVMIPEGMTEIEFRFDTCQDLTNIIIPDSVTSIVANAFRNTDYYNNPDNWEGSALYIGNHLIRVREDVEYFAVRPGTKSIAQDAFESCYKLKHLSIGGEHSLVLSPLVNLETLVITEMPTSILGYFGLYDVPITLKNIVLADGVVMNGQLISGVTVYVEAEEKDVRWNENFPGWHRNNPVVYGNKWISVDFYDNRGPSAKEIFGTSQVIRVPFTDDYVDGAWRYVFLGYDTDGDGEADVIPATSTRDILACALYQKEYRCVEEGHLLDEPPCGQRSTCAYCGEQFGEARDHELGEWTQMKAPSCLDEGMERRACAKCEYTEERAVNALGHADAAVAVENKVDATCIKDGSFDEVVYCSVCQAELSRESKVIEKLGHDHSIEWTVDIAPTCTTVGSKSHHCTGCDDMVDITEIPANGHMFGTWNQTQAPTCTEKGVERRACESCNHYEERDLSALGHDLIAHAGQSAGCTEIGWQDYVTCSRCTYSTYVEIPSLGGHVFGAWTQSVAPAPGTPGEERRLCGRCEAVESREVTYLQTFVDAVAKIPTDQCAETTYSAIYSALQIYSDLTASEKAEASETFLALQEAISAYNEKATAANEELKTASEVAFMPMSAYFGFLAALWFLLKRKLM